MMKRYLIFLFLLSGLLWAQEYTLDQLIQTGLKNSTTIKTKAIQTDNAKSSLRSAYYDMLPEADVSLSSSTSKGDITSKSGKLS
ncbi:MAG TPA: hypothetical protein PKK33_08440, partial [Candidatus Cloacimonadota bacterium]|nr:hypothetical protein [Candidatus Cloacimonadota bacterium]